MRTRSLPRPVRCPLRFPAEDARQRLAERLAAAGCVAGDEEADELVAAAGGDATRLEALVSRRLAGEPLAWVTGEISFFGARVLVHPGVYVPRRQSELLVARAVALLPDEGTAVDLCTGTGALAAVLRARRPGARVLATDIDPLACRCAEANGVEVRCGDLAAPLLGDLSGAVDIVIAVPPYVPSRAIEFLPRDAREHEPRRALDGGPAGTDVLVALIVQAAVLLRPSGSLLVELGGDQATELAPVLRASDLRLEEVLEDEEGDARGIVARRMGAGG